VHSVDSFGVSQQECGSGRSVPAKCAKPSQFL